jgi:hypothetical protein
LHEFSGGLCRRPHGRAGSDKSTRGADPSKQKLVEDWKPRKIYQNINRRAGQYETYALRMKNNSS